MFNGDQTLTYIARVTTVVLTAVTLVVIVAATLVAAKDFFLLIFLGVLFGVFLTKCAVLLQKYFPVNYGWSLAIVTLLLLSLLAGSLVLFGSKIENKLGSMSGQLDEASQQLESWLEEHPLALEYFKKIPIARKILTKDPDRDSNEEDSADSATSWKANSRPSAKNESSKNKNSAQNDAQEQSGGIQNNSDDQATDQQQNKSDSSSSSFSDKAGNKKEPSGTKLQELMPTSAINSAAGRTLAVFRDMFSTTLGLIANIGLIFFVGLFLAVDPALYRDGFATLFPSDRRDRVSEVLNLMGEAMFAWLNGRFLSMLITGAGTAISLWVLGVPMPISIGVITGLLTFIPNLGGIIALSLAMLMALTQGPMTVLWVVVLYGLLQLVESNIITPIIQQNQTSIPPALLLSFQVVLGAMTGFLGLLVATPLLAAGLVAVREVWIKDTLDAPSTS